MVRIRTLVLVRWQQVAHEPRSEDHVPPPGAVIAGKRKLADARDEPQYGERVPYVIPVRAKGAKLAEVALDPASFLAERSVFGCQSATMLIMPIHL